MRAQGVDPALVRGAVSQALNPAFLPGGPGDVAFQGATELAGHVLGPVAGKVAGASADVLGPVLGGARDLAGDAVDRTVGLVQQALGPVGAPAADPVEATLAHLSEVVGPSADRAADPLKQSARAELPVGAEAASEAVGPTGGSEAEQPGSAMPASAGAEHGPPPPSPAAGTADRSEPVLRAAVGFSPAGVKPLSIGTGSDKVREVAPEIWEEAAKAGVTIEQPPIVGRGGWTNEKTGRFYAEGALNVEVGGTRPAILGYADGLLSRDLNEDAANVSFTGPFIRGADSVAEVRVARLNAEEEAQFEQVVTEMSPEGWQVGVTQDGDQTVLSIAGEKVGRREMQDRVMQWTSLLSRAGYRIQSAAAEPADVETVWQRHRMAGGGT